MNRYTFVLPSENQNAFTYVYTQGHLVDQNFCNFEIRRRILRVEKQRNSKRTFPSLLVDLSVHFDFPERMCMYQSLSLSLYLHLQKRFGSRSDTNGIQERIFRHFKNVCKR